MEKKDSCIFCRIARGEIPCYKVYEDNFVIAFLDVNPASRGHTLVVPKEHCQDFTSCPKALLDHCFEVAQTIAQAQIAQLGATGVNVLTNVGASAGQSVLHFHIHVIPSYREQILGLKGTNLQIEDKEMLLLQDEIKRAI